MKRSIMRRVDAATPQQMALSEPRAIVSAGVREDVLDAFKSYLLATENANTLRAYRSALRYWFSWAAMRLEAPLSAPVPSIVVMTFLLDHVDVPGPDGILATTMPDYIDAELRERGLRRAKTWTVSWVRLHLAAIVKWQESQRPPDLAPDRPDADVSRAAEWASPAAFPEVQTFMKRLPRLAELRGHEPRQKTAAKLDTLDAMLATCAEDLLAPPLAHGRHQKSRELAAIRDRALLWFGWASGGRRRSEVAGAVMERLRSWGNKDAPEFTYRLGLTKTNKTGQAKSPDKPIKGAAAVALQAWLDHSGVISGPIFRDVSRGGIAGGLTPRAVARIVLRRAEAAGLPGDWGGHSLRSGFVSEAIDRGVPDAETMKMTDHRSLQSFVGYHQVEDLRRTRVSDIGSEPRAKRRSRSTS